MRISRCVVLLPLLLGCSAENVVAGKEKSQAEQVRASIPSWCQSICEEMKACEVDEGCTCQGDLCSCVGGVEEDCSENCEAELGAMARSSDACAASVERLQRCIDIKGCAILSDGDLCQFESEEMLSCGHAGDDSAPEPSPNGSNYGTAGSANLPSNGPDGGSVVSCTGGFGGGQAVPQPGTTYVICEEGRFECSDGHEYEMVCIATSDGRRACSCFVDDVVTAGFSPGDSCPSSSEMNAGCGWRLSEI